MAFAGRLFRPALTGTIAVAGYTALSSSRPLLADDSGSRLPVARPGRSPTGEKLPIYPQDETEMVTLIETPHPIAPYVGQARVALSQVLGGAGGYVSEGASRWITFERRVEKQVKTLLPPDESLTPGIIYVLVAGLTGSVLTRTRAFPLRFLTPPLFVLAAMPYFLPKTSHNLRAYLSEMEDRNFPELAASHDQLNDRLSMHWHMLTDRLGSAGGEARTWGEKAVSGFENTTGLKVGENMRKSRDRLEEQRERLQGRVMAQTQGVPVEIVGYVAEVTPVAEIVRPVPVDESDKKLV